MYPYKLFLIILSLSNAISLSIIKPNYKPEDYKSIFEDFIIKYEKQYHNEEEKLLRFEIFVKNLEYINELNSNAENARFEINKFADLTGEEISSLFSGKHDNERYCAQSCDLGDVNIYEEPEEEHFDWREFNVLTDAKIQHFCGSCWAFATIANVEAQYAISKNKQPLSLSEQQLVDCDGTNYGCNGGSMCRGLRSLINQGGVMAEEDYPYIARNRTCKKDSSKFKVKLSGCKYFNVNEEEKLKALIKYVGPLTLGVMGRDLLSYGEGVVEHKCASNHTTHAVLIVGWGSENGVPYWIFKNSFGKSWGENGYFRLKRGVNSCCLMLTMPATAIIS